MVAARIGREAYLVNIGGGAGSKEYEAIGGGICAVGTRV